MREEPWKIDDEDGNPPQRRLTGKERRFLASGETASYTKPELEERVEEKAAMLPERLCALIDDIALLQYGNYLPQNEQDWLAPHNGVSRIDAVLGKSAFAIEPQQSNDAVQFGYEIGGLLHLLQTNTSGETAWENAIWGVILEYLMQGATIADSEEDRLDELVKHLGYCTWQYFSEKPNVQEITESLQGIEESVPDQAIIDVLEGYELEPTDALLTAIDARISSFEEPIRQDRLEKEIDEMLASGSWRKMERLRSELETDKKMVKERAWLGTSASTVLKSLWNSDTAVTSQEIANDTREEQNLVTVTINRLGVESSQMWSEHPIIEEENGRWRLTAYGELLCYFCFEEKSSSWVHSFASPFVFRSKKERQLVKNALKELGRDSSGFPP